jgi:hypothetical protein
VPEPDESCIVIRTPTFPEEVIKDNSFSSVSEPPQERKG